MERGDRVQIKISGWLAAKRGAQIVEGDVRAVTEKAVQVMDEWFPRSQIEEVEYLEREEDRVGRAREIKHASGLPDPPKTVYPPWDHQRRAYHIVAQQKSVLLDMWMGTGKTKVVIDVIQNTAPTKNWRTLVVAPRTVIEDVWPGQVEEHCVDGCHLVLLNKGNARKHKEMSKEAWGLDGPVMYLVNYESVWREPFAGWVKARSWDFIVADESHAIKSPGSKCSRFMGTLRKRTDHRIALTGTPMPHSPLDVYGQARFVDPSVFGTSFARFRSRYAVMGGYGGHEVIGYPIDERDRYYHPEIAEEWNRGLERLMFSVGEEVLDLPESVDVHRRLPLAGEGRKYYDQMERDLIVDIGEGVITAQNALSRLLRLQQITSGYLPVETETGRLRPHRVDDTKERMLEELLDGLGPEEPVVVFARFRHDLDVIHQVSTALGRNSVELSGRRHELPLWQEEQVPILAAQIQAGGVGIDLTRARYCVYYSQGFSLGNYQQSRARVHRPGQERSVFYYHLTLRDTIDEIVLRSLKAKQNTIESVLRHLT